MKISQLHNHTIASHLDGIIHPKEMFERCIEKDISSIAITDHGNMAALLSAQIISRDIENCPKLIFGIEAYIVDEIKGQKGEKKNHICLLAQNEIGFKNLLKLNNFAWTEGFYAKPRIDFNILKKYKEGLYIGSACVAGVLSRFYNNQYKAEEELKKYYGEFGNNFYIEFQFISAIDEYKDDKQKFANLSNYALCIKHNIPFVITTDTHILKKEDYLLHQKVLKINTKGAFVFDSSELWLKGYNDLLISKEKYFNEMSNNDFNRAICYANDIADNCNYVIPIGGYHIPKFNYKLDKSYNKQLSSKEFLKDLLITKLIKFGQRANIDEHLKPIYKQRLIKEYATICKMNAEDYILIVYDLIQYLRSKNILVMTRGSANGSLICFLLEFSYIDPVFYNILFERFISSARAELGVFDVDIDIDLESEARSIAVDYLKNKYTDNRICNVGNVNRLKLKAAIKDMARVFHKEAENIITNSKLREEEKKVLENVLENYNFKKVNRITAMLQPGTKQESSKICIEESLEKYKELKEWWDDNSSFINNFVNPIVNLEKASGIHAAGIAILPTHMDEWIPIRTQSNPQNKKERIKCTQWCSSHDSGDVLREFGLMTLDVLGVKTLSIIAAIVKDIKKYQNKDINISNLNRNDPFTIEQFKQGHTFGVFQLNAPHISKIVKNIKPDNFDDIINLMALNRPGALINKSEVEYEKRKHDNSQIRYFHESLKDVLSDTYGIPIYSEHIMKIGTEFAGMDNKDAEILRKISKAKKGDEILKYKEKFISGAIEKWGDNIKEIAEELWGIVEAYGAYSFPKGHAAGYGFISFLTMYFKCNHPLEFFKNYLNYISHEEYNATILEAKKYNIKITYPDINNSEKNFCINNGKIFCGLNTIKGLGDNVVTEILNKRPFHSFSDFYSKINKRILNKARVEALIISGCFDDFGNTLDLLKEYYSKRQNEKKSVREKEKEKFPTHYISYSKQKWLIMKSEILGFQTISYSKMFSNTDYVLDSFNEFLDNQVINDFKTFNLCGKVSYVKIFNTKVKDICVGKISDINGSIPFVIWNNLLTKLQSNDILIQEGDIIIISGTKRTNKDGYNLSCGEKNNVKIIQKKC